jgi:hypothetical protein
MIEYRILERDGESVYWVAKSEARWLRAFSCCF